MKTTFFLVAALFTFNTAFASTNNESHRIADILRLYIKKNVNYLKFASDDSNCIEQSISFNPFEGGPCYLTIHKNFNCRGKGGKIISATSVDMSRTYVSRGRKHDVILFSPERNRIAERIWGIVGENGPMNEGWPSGKSEAENDFIESIQTTNLEQANNITQLFADLIKSCRNSD